MQGTPKGVLSQWLNNYFSDCRYRAFARYASTKKPLFRPGGEIRGFGLIGATLSAEGRYAYIRSPHTGSFIARGVMDL